MKTALIGCGKAGKVLLEELIGNQHIDKIEIFDPGIQEHTNLPISTEKEVVIYSDFKNFKPEFDLIIIASPDHLHSAFTLKAINNGIDCFIEKPLVTTREDFHKIQSALILHPNLKITSNLILRAAPLFIELKKLFASGIFGGKISVEGKYLYGRWDKLVNGWRGQPDYSVVLGGLIHLVDLLCFITGNYEYESHIEYARLTRKFPYDVNDFSSMILSNEIIGVANLTTNFSTPIDHRRDFSIYGDKSWVEVVGKEISVGGSLVDYNLKNLKASAGTKGDLLRAFIGDIHGDTKTLYQYPTRDEMLDVIEICLG